LKPNTTAREIATSFQQKWHAKQRKNNHEDIMTDKEKVERYLEGIPEDLEPPVSESNFVHDALAPSSKYDISRDQPFSTSVQPEIPTVVENGLRIDNQQLIQSRAFRWLLTRLQRKLRLVTADPDNLSIARENILDTLPSSGKVSRSQPVKTFRSSFNVDWDVRAFVAQQDYRDRADEAIATAITLTGGSDGAQATTVTQYFDQTWPISGPWILQALKSAVLDGSCHFNACEYLLLWSEQLVILTTMELLALLRRDLEIDIYLQNFKTLVEVYGTADFIAEVGEQIAWLGSALRSSPFDRGVAICTPYIHRVLEQPSAAKIGSSKSHVVHAIIHYELCFHVEHIYQQPLQNGICWHGLFNNPILVQGFPIPFRANNDNGLEISLHMMAGLIQARRITNFDGQIYIKSFSSLLFPTKKVGGIIFWHLLYNGDGSRISYLDPRVKSLGAVKTDEINFFGFEHMRHVLGWCTKAENYAGTYSSWTNTLLLIECPANTKNCRITPSGLQH
jgi:hypothetical protein